MAKNDFKGLNEFLKYTDELPENLKKDAMAVITNSTHSIEKRAKNDAPVDTGTLRNSIKSTVEQNKVQGSVSVNADYGKFVEFGTSKQSAQPFLFNNLNKERNTFISNMKRILDK